MCVADSFALLLLSILGLLPAVQRGVHIPTGKNNAVKGAFFWNVPSFILLPSENNRGPASRTGPPYRIRVHNLLDGGPQGGPYHLHRLPPRRPLQCLGLPEPGPRHRRHPHGLQTSNHFSLRHHPRVPDRGRILRPADPAIHRVAQVLELQLLLLQALARCPIQRRRLLRVLAGRVVPRHRVPGNQINGAGKFVD